MNSIRFYRGSNQIGGISTEIRSGDHRVIIDFGSNLPGTEDAAISDDELVNKVFGPDSDGINTDAVLFTHYHGDHVGLKNRIPDRVGGMYAGPLAIDIMKIIANGTDYVKEKTGQTDDLDMPVLNKMKPYWMLGSPRNFGGIKVTPLVCDHSAVDAYMFVIELGGKRILYTGDFRDHGVTGSETFENLIREHVGKIDILITEGTMVSRTDEVHENPIRTEDQLGEEAARIFEAHKENVVLVSSTNLDSVMQFYHATPPGKAFICDPYQARVMKAAIAARHKYFPKVYSYDRRKIIYVLCPGEYEGYMKDLTESNNEKIGRRFWMARPDIYLDKGFVMLARPNRNPNANPGKFEERLLEMKDPFITYSMWTGYLENGKAPDQSVVGFMKGRMDDEHMKVLHTSGHAYVETIKKLMDMTDPDVIIPMHTDASEAFETMDIFREYHSRIRRISDDDIYEVR